MNSGPRKTGEHVGPTRRRATVREAQAVEQPVQIRDTSGRKRMFFILLFLTLLLAALISGVYYYIKTRPDVEYLSSDICLRTELPKGDAREQVGERILVANRDKMQMLKAAGIRDDKPYIELVNKTACYGASARAAMSAELNSGDYFNDKTTNLIVSELEAFVDP